jgi:hypothetical protein
MDEFDLWNVKEDSKIPKRLARKQNTFKTIDIDDYVT